MGEWMYFIISAIAGGEWSASRPDSFTPSERASGTHWIGGLVDPRASLDDVEKRKLLTLPWLELRPLGRPARNQTLHRVCYVGSQLLGADGYFQLDGAASHTSNQTFEEIILGGEKFTSEKLWHPGFQIWLCRTSSCDVCWRRGCLKTNHKLLTTCKEILLPKLLQSPFAMQCHVSLCLQRAGNPIPTSSVTQLSPHLRRYVLKTFRFHK
jgi:hypothetical protein